MSEPKFEKDLEKLEVIVDALEEGGLSLDDSLKKFEEGIKLSRRCEKALNSVEKKIEVLTRNAEGKLEAAPFEASDAPESGAKAPPRDTAGSEGEAKVDEGGLLF